LGSAEWWRVAKRHFVGDSCDEKQPFSLELPTTTLSNPLDIANHFAKHFGAVHTSTVALVHPSSAPTCGGDVALRDNWDGSISQNYIRFLIDSLPRRKANLDNIPPSVIKYVSLTIADPLSFLVQRSVRDSGMPRCLKLSRVLPLHKGGSRQCVSNYRPIALQSVFATITEKAALRIANAYVHKHRIVPGNQFGFKPHHSCIHACLYHLSTVYGSIAKNLKVGCLYVDIRNAFPSVDHDLLLRALQKHDFIGLSFAWFSGYLRNRSMFVDVNGAQSDVVSVTRGVPQGSLFGPLLFSIYFNGMSDIFEQNAITLFADDTAITSSAPSTLELVRNMEYCLAKTDNYLRELRMELNTSKTQFMVFKCADPSLQLSVNSCKVNQCSSFKYLGIHIDDNLSWNTHVSALIRKVLKMLYLFHRASGRSNNGRRLLLFRTYIYPHFIYGIELYMLCSVSLRAKLEALFRRCCRLVLGDINWPHVMEGKCLYKRLDVLPLRFLFQYNGAVLMYKILVLKSIPILLTLFDIVPYVHRLARLHPAGIVVLRLPIITTESSRHSFAYWGAKLWNSIAVNIRSCSTLYSFSQSYREYLVSCIDTASTDNYDILDFV
jgi:hypothetical protein